MKRIIPEQVVEAYKKTGLKPERLCFFEGNGCACAFGALYVANGGVIGDVEAADEFADHFAESRKYASGFIHGFDGMKSLETLEEYKVGYQDGVASWVAVKDLQ